MTAALTCRDVLDLVTEYLEGTMQADARLRFERHLAICPPCRGFLAQMRETLRLTGQLREEELSPETRKELIHAFRQWSSEGGEA